MDSNPRARRILICAALRWECRCVLRALRRVSRHRCGPFTVWQGDSSAGDVVVVKTGIGPSQAAAAVRTVTDRGPFDLYLSTGCAGALVPDLGCGDAVLASELADGSGDRWPIDDDSRTPLQDAARRAGIRTVVGPVLCSSRVLSTTAEKSLAAERSGAIAVEMEGIPIAAHAAAEGAPFVSLRVVLDPAAVSLGESDGLIDVQTGDVKPLAVVRSLVSGKSSWTALRSMQKMQSIAEARLQRLFAAYLTFR